MVPSCIIFVARTIAASLGQEDQQDQEGSKQDQEGSKGKDRSKEYYN